MVEIVDRVLAGERLSAEEGLVLYETPDVHLVCGLADIVRSGFTEMSPGTTSTDTSTTPTSAP